MLSIVFIGYGPIASYVRDNLPAEAEVRITAILCRPGREDAARAFAGPDVLVATNVADLPADSLDLAEASLFHRIAASRPLTLGTFPLNLGRRYLSPTRHRTDQYSVC